MTGIIDNDSEMRKIAKKIPLEEFFGEESIKNKDFNIRQTLTRSFSIKTYFRDAERIAFKKARKFAKKIKSKIICYTTWSGANSDFMNGTDKTPHLYELTATFY